MSFGNAKWVWMNGKMVPWEKATVHASVHALHYGSGVFEGIRCYETEDGPALFRLDAHLERFVCSAAVYEMSIPYTSKELTEAITELVSANGFASCYVRPLCFRGSCNLRVDPEDCPVDLSILAWPWAPLHGSDSSKAGLRVCISRRKKFHSDMMPPTAKASGQYVNSILAIREAKHQGYDEPILLNTEGYLAEAASENIFLIHGNTIVTNDEQDSILLGITRLSVIEIARDLGYEVKIVRLTIDDLMTADEAFVTGTAAEVVHISQVDGKRIGNGQCGPITLRIQQEYMRAVQGRNPGYAHWLLPVKKATAMQV
ncbi:MAG: branched chain amino acid aminotransferase [Candidatus Angelobacter sp. Gp1-AA117]|nr:MAG: branched chain amino acid aminotransferase [Candidatus Angelobacter sp. Gp1-AA117]